MTVRRFPGTREPPKLRILLVPFLLMIGGLFLLYMHPFWNTGFIGIILALTGVLTLFVAGMIFADLWAASRRMKDIRKIGESSSSQDTDVPIDYDPFEESIGEIEDE